MVPAAKVAATRLLRRAPWPLSVPVVRRRAVRAQADGNSLAVARRQMDFLLHAVRPGLDLDPVARRHLEHAIRRRELRWHPREISDQRVVGVEHLSSRGPSGGLVVCFLHHGFFEGAFLALKRAGAPPLTTVAHPDLFDAVRPSYLAAHMRLIRAGSTPVAADRGYAGLRDLVLQGHTLAIAVDQRGSTRVRFLDRDMRCASGAARIAHETGTPIVLLTGHPAAGCAQELRVSEPLLPGAHLDAESLLTAMLCAFEPAVLAWPEAYDWPRGKFVLLDADGAPRIFEQDPGEPD